MTELEGYIQQYFELDTSSASALSKCFVRTDFSKGDMFSTQGKPCRQLAFLKSGVMRVYRYTENKEVTQWILTPGEFAADLSSLTFGTPARWHIEALEPCETYLLAQQEYEQIGSNIPEWPQIEKLFIAKCFLTLEDRVFSFLSLTAEERYAQFMLYKGHLLNQVPHHYIASMLGMTPETLSRVRRKFIS